MGDTSDYYRTWEQDDFIDNPKKRKTRYIIRSRLGDLAWAYLDYRHFKKNSDTKYDNKTYRQYNPCMVGLR